MKFLTPGRVAKIRGSQNEARACYMNVLRKGTKCDEGTSVIMTIHSKPMDIDSEKMNEEMILDEGLDPRIIGSNSLTSPAEELEAFSVNPSDPRQRLEEKMKEELKQFL
ncbi:Uncharacterized protein Adt_35361 [Abeliophyllum distichum]|uniref:Uncharacterized protein n=1 Tax=Abeliophyllum distichum TaxID=126358 RepID=A0ABD1QEH6_9LAMI